MNAYHLPGSPKRTGVASPKRTGGGYRLPRQPEAPKTHPAVLDVFDLGRRAAGRTPYHLDKDESMYTTDALDARERLRANPGLVDAVRRFIHLVYSVDADGLISPAEYARVHREMVSILMGDACTPADLERITNDDWVSDAKGAGALDGQLIFDALFELADIWCPGISAVQYLSFIDTLAYKIVQRRAAHASDEQADTAAGSDPTIAAGGSRSSSENRAANAVA